MIIPVIETTQNFDFGLISLSLGLGFLYFLLADLGLLCCQI
jgi:hypothetical protein